MPQVVRHLLHNPTMYSANAGHRRCHPSAIGRSTRALDKAPRPPLKLPLHPLLGFPPAVDTYLSCILYGVGGGWVGLSRCIALIGVRYCYTYLQEKRGTDTCKRIPKINPGATLPNAPIESRGAVSRISDPCLHLIGNWQTHQQL